MTPVPRLDRHHRSDFLIERLTHCAAIIQWRDKSMRRQRIRASLDVVDSGWTSVLRAMIRQYDVSSMFHDDVAQWSEVAPPWLRFGDKGDPSSLGGRR